jgi:hypothetical protein
MSLKEKLGIKTEEDFNHVMESIDEELRTQNMPIFGREVEGWSKFCARYSVTLTNVDPLTIEIWNWFRTRYGDKLKIDFSIGQLAILIRGDLFKIRFPLIYGVAEFICDPKYFGISHQKRTNVGVPPTLNVLDFVEGLTEQYANNLTFDELQNIFDLYKFGFESMLDIDEISGSTFITQAKADINATLSHLFDSLPNYGLSKWSSLQAVEKFIKAYIERKGNTPPFSHDLVRLTADAELLGLPTVSRTDLAKIQCPADVRYGQVLVSLIEAIEAHQAAIGVCAKISKNL